MQLVPLLEWLDQHPKLYLYGVVAAIVGAVAMAIRPLWQGKPDDTPRHDWVWGLVLLAILTAGRWPTLFFERMLNSDECQMLAGAHALRFDPVFWRSVNGATAGPLDFFALWPAGSLCGADGYFSARLTALGLLAICLALTHQCLTLNFGRTPARWATLVTGCFESMSFSSDFLHYSTELMPIALLAGAAYAAVRRWATSGGGWQWSWLGGILLGAVPMAKIQAVPVALVAGIAWAAFEFRQSGPGSRRAIVYLLVGAITPTALFASQLALAGEWETFVKSFFIYNLTYVSENVHSLGQTLNAMVSESIKSKSLAHVWIIGSGLWVGLMCSRPSGGERKTRFLLLGAATLAGVAALCVLAPRRPSLHYLQLLVVPVTLLLGTASARLIEANPILTRRRAQWLIAAIAVTIAGTMVGTRVFSRYSMFGVLAHTQQSRSHLTLEVMRASAPGETLAVWGWTNELYVETNLRQATRDSHIGPLFETGAMKPYFQERYIADLVRNRPEVFVDSVGMHSVTFKSLEYRPERALPALAAVVAADYALVATVGDSRIYRRKDLIAQ